MDTVKLLFDYKINANEINNEGNNTPAHIICNNVILEEEIITYLIERSSNLNRINNDRETPLIRACYRLPHICKYGKEDFEKILIKYGNTPLMIARMDNNERVIKSLLILSAGDHNGNIVTNPSTKEVFIVDIISSLKSIKNNDSYKDDNARKQAIENKFRDLYNEKNLDIFRGLNDDSIRLINEDPNFIANKNNKNFNNFIKIKIP
ncbi:hypothetical protein H8356DRAFT_1357428 [Neocallimastix lanati (nom. inval.)]|nr:hypothetical protein H8356DRAFT_1357428 [Neocallimastix sp. JGI-2020a]